MNINNIVVIPTAGAGTRLRPFTNHINKALLPYKGKPIISYIIEQFPQNSKFLIPVGYQAEQVKTFCEMVYPQLDITFIDINDWNIETGGTGSTLRQCCTYIDRAFWYVPCDTYFNEELLTSEKNDRFFIAKIDSSLHKEYTTFLIKNNKITDIQFKQTTDESYCAFTGLMYIHNFKDFFDKLTKHQGNEFIDILPINGQVSLLPSWIDMGNYDIYTQARLVDQEYDFSKTEEITYIVNSKVVKWYKDSTIPEAKFQRYQFNPSVFPENCKTKSQFLVYDFFEGNVVYKDYSTSKFIKLLDWLKKDLWISTDKNIKSCFHDFYKSKTLSRIEMFHKKYTHLSNCSSINNIPVRDYRYYLKKIDWDYLVKSVKPTFIHGDLHFDNLITDNQDNFKIIDWRYGFGEEVIYGDLYYDLAKLLGGLILNYSEIKKNNFQIEFIVDKVNLYIPSVENLAEYQSILNAFVYENNLDYEKVLQLVPIIFWNMAPLHHRPFDLFLWYLGIYYFEKFPKF